MDDLESAESSYNDGGDDDSSFADEEEAKQVILNSVEAKIAPKMTKRYSAKSNRTYSDKVSPANLNKRVFPPKRGDAATNKLHLALDLSDRDSSDFEGVLSSAVKAKSPSKRRIKSLELSDVDDSSISKYTRLAVSNPNKKKVGLELSDDNSYDTESRLHQKISNVDQSNDDDSSYDSMEVKAEAPKTTSAKAKAVPNLSKAIVRTKAKKQMKDIGDSFEEGKELNRPVKIAAVVPKKRKSVTKKIGLDDFDALDIVLPPNLTSHCNGEFTLLVQIDPDHGLDFTGAVGAVGRIEVDDERVMLDLKGTQFTGKLFPGPTTLVLAVTSNNEHDPYLKVESITDEFCSLVKTGDAIAKMNAAVRQGMDDFYDYEDEDVNRTAKGDTTIDAADAATASDAKKRKTPSKPGAHKRKKSKK